MTSIITFLLGIPILVIGIWLKHELGTECESYLNAPLITLGALILSFSVAGIIYAARLKGLQLCCHGYIMFVLLTTLLGYSIFALVVSAKGGGEPLARRGYKEYRLEDYSSWLKKRVDNTKHWNQLKTCIYKSQVCSKFGDKFGDNTQDQFYSNKLSSIESGCCKPSNDCSFKYISPTEWTKPKEDNYTNEDCKKWGNDKDVLCFNCQSCKAGLADSVKRNWNKAGIVCIIFVILLMVFSYLGCIVVENPQLTLQLE
ncbi:unnamed protein product [Amaranthus hypochondriacus]